MNVNSVSAASGARSSSSSSSSSSSTAPAASSQRPAPPRAPVASVPVTFHFTGPAPDVEEAARDFEQLMNELNIMLARHEPPERATLQSRLRAACGAARHLDASRRGGAAHRLASMACFVAGRGACMADAVALLTATLPGIADQDRRDQAVRLMLQRVGEWIESQPATSAPDKQGARDLVAALTFVASHARKSTLAHGKCLQRAADRAAKALTRDNAPPEADLQRFITQVLASAHQLPDVNEERLFFTVCLVRTLGKVATLPPGDFERRFYASLIRAATTPLMRVGILNHAYDLQRPGNWQEFVARLAHEHAAVPQDAQGDLSDKLRQHLQQLRSDERQHDPSSAQAPHPPGSAAPGDKKRIDALWLLAAELDHELVDARNCQDSPDEETVTRLLQGIERRLQELELAAPAALRKEIAGLCVDATQAEAAMPQALRILAELAPQLEPAAHAELVPLALATVHEYLANRGVWRSDHNEAVLKWLAAHVHLARDDDDGDDSDSDPDSHGDKASCLQLILNLACAWACHEPPVQSLPQEDLHRIAGQVGAAVTTIPDVAQRHRLAKKLANKLGLHAVMHGSFAAHAHFCRPWVFCRDSDLARQGFIGLVELAQRLPDALLDKIAVISFVVDPRGDASWTRDSNVVYGPRLRARRAVLQQAWEGRYRVLAPRSTDLEWSLQHGPRDGFPSIIRAIDVRDMWQRRVTASFGAATDVAREMLTFLGNFWSQESLFDDLLEMVRIAPMPGDAPSGHPPGEPMPALEPMQTGEDATASTRKRKGTTSVGVPARRRTGG